MTTVKVSLPNGPTVEIESEVFETILLEAQASIRLWADTATEEAELLSAAINWMQQGVVPERKRG